LQKLAKLSTPAWVRESEAKTSPESSMVPTQYVMGVFPFPFFEIIPALNQKACVGG
jgi:hypothetical protein